jgi:hypothetical protein
MDRLLKNKGRTKALPAEEANYTPLDYAVNSIEYRRLIKRLNRFFSAFQRRPGPPGTAFSLLDSDPHDTPFSDLDDYITAREEHSVDVIDPLAVDLDRPLRDQAPGL